MSYLTNLRFILVDCFLIKTLVKNPEAPIFGLVFIQFSIELCKILLILFRRLDARLRRRGAVRYFPFNLFCHCPPVCPLAVHRVRLVLISPPAIHWMDVIGG